MGAEARLSYLLTAVAGGFAMTVVRNETQRHSAALKNAGQNPIGLLPLCVYEISNRAGSAVFSAIEYRHVLLRPPWGQAGDKNRNSSETQGG